MNGANGSCVVGGGGVIVEARDLVLSFGETPALRGASISVKRGEIVAVMGPSGSGKSTLLRNRPRCVAGHLGAGVTTDLDIRPTVVAVQHRSVRQPGDRPDRRCRDRAERSGPAWASPPARAG